MNVDKFRKDLAMLLKTARPVGSTSIRSDGKTYVKVDEGNWLPKKEAKMALSQKNKEEKSRGAKITQSISRMFSSVGDDIDSLMSIVHSSDGSTKKSEKINNLGSKISDSLDKIDKMSKYDSWAYMRDGDTDKIRDRLNDILGQDK
jgi:hypothetical protein